MEPGTDQIQEPEPKFSTIIVQKVRENLIFRSKWAEINGAMGDLDTCVPIILPFTLASDLNLGSTLICTGIYNIVTCAIYGVPMPVQPMKSIAAVAISASTGTSSDPFGVPEVMAAGILTGGILLILGVTGLMQLVYRLIPISVVRGIQLSQGLSSAMTAVKYIRKVQDFKKTKSLGDRPWLGLDGLILAVFCVFFIVLVNGGGDDECERDSNLEGEEDGSRVRVRSRVRRILLSIPSAFVVILLGVVLCHVPGMIPRLLTQETRKKKQIKRKVPAEVFYWLLMEDLSRDGGVQRKDLMEGN